MVDIRREGRGYSMGEVSRTHWQSPPTDLTLTHVEWLKERGPAEWHRAALSWNFGTTVHTLAWIVNQPGCDRGTAIAIFHRCEPTAYLVSRVPDLQAYLVKYGHSDEFDLMMMIIDLWNAGEFPSYRYEPIPNIVWDYPRVRAQDLAFAVPDALADPEIKGERLNTDDYAEGFSPEFR
jgi:hypothetical protein